MTNDEIAKELETIRTQLEELRQQSVSSNRGPRTKRFGRRDANENGENLQEPEGAEGNEWALRFRGLLEDFEEDIGRSRPLTTLVVFGVGLLVGRLFAK